MMNAVRIRTRLESTTLTAPELAPFLGRRVGIIVLEDEPQGRPLLVTRGIFAVKRDIPGDPRADVQADLHVERARHMDATVDEAAGVAGADRATN